MRVYLLTIEFFKHAALGDSTYGHPPLNSIQRTQFATTEGAVDLDQLDYIPSSSLVAQALPQQTNEFLDTQEKKRSEELSEDRCKVVSEGIDNVTNVAMSSVAGLVGGIHYLSEENLVGAAIATGITYIPAFVVTKSFGAYAKVVKMCAPW